MAAAKAMTPSAHAKLHKRNLSDTSNSIHNSPSPSMPLTAFSPTFDYRNNVTYEEDPSSAPSSLKIKPYFRRLNAKDSGVIDLSRPAAENEGLAGLGLGINDGIGYGFTTSKSVSDVSFMPMGSYNKSRHIRSASNNSQFSTTTANSMPRPNAPYAHPMRQTPRPYTPPISKSFTPSLGGRSSDDLDAINQAPLHQDEDLTFRRLMTASTDPSTRRSGSISSAPTNIAAPQPLRIRTSDSVTRFTSPSQTSLPGIGGGRSRGATLQSVDTMSPSSRPSMDKAFSFLRVQRSNTDTELDPAESRAASVRAARKAFQEREDAKLRKVEKEEMKQLEKEQRRQHKKQRQAEPDERRSGRSRNDSINEKGEEIGRDYATLRPVNTRTLPNRVERISPGRRDNASERSRPKKKRGAKTNWFAFLTWFRTRLLRLSRRMGMRN